MADTPGGADAGGVGFEGVKDLLDVTRRINAEVDPDAVLGTIVDSLVTIVGADRGFLSCCGATTDG